MNFTKLLTSCKEKRQGLSNQAFNPHIRNKQGRSRKWSQTNPNKTSEQQRCKCDKRKRHHAKYK